MSTRVSFDYRRALDARNGAADRVRTLKSQLASAEEVLAHCERAYGVALAAVNAEHVAAQAKVGPEREAQARMS